MTRIVRRTPKLDRDACIDVNVLTAVERGMLVSILARFTTGGGPYPEAHNLKYWRAHYALACIKKAFKHVTASRRIITPAGRDLLRSLEKKVLAMATKKKKS